MVLKRTLRAIAGRRRFMLVAAGLLALVLALVPLLEARSDSESDSNADNDDHELALAAFQSGEIVSLREMLADVEGRFPGQVIDVDLESKRNGDRHTWVYEIKLIEPNGTVVKLAFDAKTKEILKKKGRDDQGTSKR